MSNENMRSTTDHSTIKKWVEERKGKPGLAKDNKETGRAGGLLRLSFPGDSTGNVDKLPWDKFFTIFDENNLKFVYREEPEGESKSTEFQFENKTD